jgi:hypothetical protein
MALLRVVLTIALLAVLVLVGGRFVALLLDADRTDLVTWLLDASQPCVQPFVRVFGLEDEMAPGGGVFEFASFVAFGAYLLGGSALVMLAGQFAGDHDRYHNSV